MEIIKRKIQIFPEEDCPDEKDITYFALALYLRCPLWSNEKRLKEQKEVIVYATHELMKLFNLV